MHITRVIKLS